MSDSQSRYGIMNELNESKIQKKENLAKLEADVDQAVFITRLIFQDYRKH